MGKLSCQHLGRRAGHLSSPVTMSFHVSNTLVTERKDVVTSLLESGPKDSSHLISQISATRAGDMIQ